MKAAAEFMEAVCREMYIPMVSRVFGPAGVTAALEIVEAVRSLYAHVEPERILGEVVVYRMVDVRGKTTKGKAAKGKAGSIVDMGELANANVDDLHLEVGADQKLYRSKLKKGDVGKLAQGAVIYTYRDGEERFWAGMESKVVAKFDLSARSQFCLPTLANVREALGQYAVNNVRESTCFIFRDVWFDEARLFFRNKPEWVMRRSMTQFLRTRLGGDHEVWPEQNVDESHPVDIRVQPRLGSNRLILIEIKWMGDSARAEGKVTVQYRDKRAREGAQQLAEYLDQQRCSAPRCVVQGYYVIIDGRRRGLAKGVAEISKENGYFYENREVRWGSRFDELRDDFDPPYRMFARPVCSGE